MTMFPESHQDLLQTDVAVLATVGRDGTPQATAVWFLLDDDGQLTLSLNTSRQKTKNLLRQPACTLFLLDRANPYRALEVRARVAIAPDDEYAFADRIAKKYGGADLRRMDGPGQSRVVVTLHPVRINATAMG